MNAAYFSAFAALAGSVIGGLTTFAAAWVTQRQQANVQWFLQEKTRRQEFYTNSLKRLRNYMWMRSFTMSPQFHRL
jgi:membrane protein YqaA with SNARE-associated domain